MTISYQGVGPDASTSINIAAGSPADAYLQNLLQNPAYTDLQRYLPSGILSTVQDEINGERFASNGDVNGLINSILSYIQANDFYVPDNVTGATLTNNLSSATQAITATDTTIYVQSPASFPNTGKAFYIWVGSGTDREEMLVTAGWGTNVWTVQRGVNGTGPKSNVGFAHNLGELVQSASLQTGTVFGMTSNPTDPAYNTIQVQSANGFPTQPYVILVDSEEMLVTANFGQTSWTVTRGYNGTTVASHAANARVTVVTALGMSTQASTIDVAPTVHYAQTSLETALQGEIVTSLALGMNAGDPMMTVNSSTGFPLAVSTDPTSAFYVQIDNEIIQVTDDTSNGNQWTISTGQEGHNGGGSPGQCANHFASDDNGGRPQPVPDGSPHQLQHLVQRYDRQ